jgi:poly(3-hydroxybutyrate) depolymerase
VLVIHGIAYQHVLFEGGAPAVTVDSHPRIDHSVHYALTFWAARNRCALQATQARAGSVVHEVFLGCEGGSAVELIAIEGGAHAWPGGVKFSPQGDEPSQEVDASELIWDCTYPKP